ncbi:MAG: cellulase family glycosylhydrolase, partial [Clostridia bacterium]|nr:cellulase family glycosylhydrolase [Clostridia bacterium]
IAEYFKDYDLHLIFEGANEELGDRLNDIPFEGCEISAELQAKLDAAGIEQKKGTLTKDQCYAEANRINQLFVDTVRATGGNNAERFLLIPGYNTDFTATCDPRFQMPKDTAVGKLLLSVHYYTPWSYCGSSGESRWGTIRNFEEMNGLCEMMSQWTAQGFGVVIGECSAMPTSVGALKPGALDWFANFYDNCDLYNFVPMLWETGDFHNKETGDWIDDAFVSFMQERSNDARAQLTANEIYEHARTEMAALLEEAPESFTYSDIPSDAAVAWIMWDSADWNLFYSVGDTYDPDSRTAGIVAQDAEITGWGTYTISLDFSETPAGANTGTAFSAIGLRYGEVLFPGYVIDVVSITCDGKTIPMKGRAYTTSDDGLCTRVNLYNGWVSAVPPEGRTRGGGTIGCSPTIISSDSIGTFKKIEITFRYVPGAQGASENDLRKSETPSF